MTLQGAWHACRRTSSPRDEISYDLLTGTLTLHVPDETLAARRENWRSPTLTYDVGYLAIFAATAG